MAVSAFFDEGSDTFAGWTPVLWDPIGAALVELADPRPGDRVLDACCGAGSSALPAATAVGPTGRVDAVDMAEGLLAHGRSRASGNVTFTCADVTGWDRDGYDVVQCGFGVFFLPDMDADTDRLVGLLRPGGRFAMTTWLAESIGELFRPYFAAVGEHRPDILAGPPPQFAGNSERLQTAEALRSWLAARGLGALRVERREHEVPVDGPRGWDFLLGGPVRSMLASVTDDTRERIHQSFLANFAADRVRTPFLVAVGTR